MIAVKVEYLVEGKPVSKEEFERYVTEAVGEKTWWLWEIVDVEREIDEWSKTLVIIVRADKRGWA